jgi:hypothetical protein
MKFVTLTYVIIILCSKAILSQYQNVQIGAEINQYEPQELSVILNPLNTNEILVGANQDNYYYSTNSGMSWQHNVISSSFGVVGDPCVLVDNNGNYFYIHLVPGLSRVVCQKATTIGGAWSNGTFTGVNGTKENDKEWGAVNMSNNFIYLSWAQFDEHGSTSQLDSSEIQLSRSTDGGIIWSSPVRISERNGNAMGGNYSAHAPMPAIGPGNEVYVTWMGPLGLMVDKSTDSGESWLENDINVTGSHIDWLVFNIGGIQRAPGFPVINCDLSPGEYYGNIYICWTDQRRGYNDTNVYLAKSTDGGISWSDPIRVNDDPPGRHQFFAWMTIDQSTGFLYFVFYDRRNHSDDSTDVYMAVSQDGGETFDNFMISESPFRPYTVDFIGDYIGISAANNIVRPVWTRVENHQLSIHTAIVDYPVDVDHQTTNSLPTEFTLSQNYPNPFNPSTVIEYSTQYTGPVTLKVYNTLGNEISILVDENKTAGKYTIEFDAAGISSGIYFYRLESNNEIITRKMILMK